MRPEKLVMKNFGPFAGRAELDFSRLEDIFLITGKTGSGKTTIFDAICFALYGKVPGSRGNYTNRLRSDHSANGTDGAGDDECLVSLEFSLGEKHFFAERSPKQEKKKKRGSGSTIAEETVVLYEIIDGEKTNPSSKKSEADQKIRELIGLDAEEFFKIVLLPQGEFAEFLRQNTSERQKVLGKLFPVEKAAQVRELAQEKARDAETKAAEAARVLGDINSKVSFDTYEAMHQAAEDSYQAARDRAAAIGIELSRFNHLITLHTNEEETTERLEESQEQEQRIEEAGTLINEKELTLSASRSARPLKPVLNAAEQAYEAARTAAAAFVSAGEERILAEKAVAASESRGAEMLRLEKETLVLREKRPALVEMKAESQKLESEKKEQEYCAALIKEKEKKTEILRAELETREEKIRELEILAAEGPVLEQQLEQARVIKDKTVELRKIFIQQMERNSRVNELEQRQEELEQRLPLLREELKNIRAEKNADEQADMAAHLSAELKDDEPCPVCGSTAHPHPAAAHAARFSFDERINAMEHSLGDAEQNLAVVNTELASQEIELEKLNEEIRGIKYDRPLPAKTEQLDELIRNQAVELNNMLTRQGKVRDAANRIKILYREQGEAQKTMTEEKMALAALREKEKNLALTIAEKQQRYDGILRNALPAVLTASNGLSHAAHSTTTGRSFTNAGEALSALDKLISLQETALAQFRKEKEDAALALAAAVANEKTSRQRRDETSAQEKETAATLKKELANSPFADSKNLRESLLDPGTEKNLEEEIRRWREDRIEVRSRITETEKQLAMITEELKGICKTVGLKYPPGQDDIASRLEALEDSRGYFEEERDKTFAELKSLERDQDALKEAHERHEALAAKARGLRNLSNDLSGKNPQKKPFDSWLLGLYLAEVAAFATKRLEKMSEGRYSLLLDSERESGRSYAGLDLTVFDAYTGKTRPCATLSGGESFMASISLALGLADSIQSRSGGVRLDAVFIDEGFGSLDEGSLDKALLILDELRDRRMVGLISHVGEMRSRIPCKVEVVKTGQGSRIETAAAD
ncbi:nuclease SbcCD subunit C [Spirochaetia bacterium]|nr:nuclease SbcCD subunit C [Spirochaetia bacterium]